MTNNTSNETNEKVMLDLVITTKQRGSRHLQTVSDTPPASRQCTPPVEMNF